jgi:surfactin synthase thioesterase subunit
MTSAQICVICFPPAGGTAQIFEVWRAHFPKWIEVIGVEYPGRGTRVQEATVPDVGALADDLASRFSLKTEGPFALLGLSMGALVAFDFATRLTQRGKPPIHLFVCSCRNPRQQLRRKLHEVPEVEFVAALRRRQGASRFIRDDADPSRPELDALRADVTASERYVAPSGETLNCPLSVFAGRRDTLLTRRGLALWSLLTSGRFLFEQFAGGHFFFRDHLDEVAARITDELLRGLK